MRFRGWMSEPTRAIRWPCEQATDSQVVAHIRKALQQAAFVAQDGVGRRVFASLQFDAKVDKDVARRHTTRVILIVDHLEDSGRGPWPGESGLGEQK